MKRILALLIPGLLAGPAHASPAWECRAEQDQWLCLNRETGERVGPGEPPRARARQDPGLRGLRDPRSAWRLCPLPPDRGYRPPTGLARDQAPVRLYADRAARDEQDRYRLSGDVILERADQRVRASRLRFDSVTRQADAEGGLSYDEPDLSVRARRGTLWLREQRAEFRDLRYRLYPRHARGKADRARLSDDGVMRLDDVLYTTCPEGRQTWQLRASRLRLDPAEGQGEARGARLEIHGKPVLFAPYFSFPIDDRRKTGFLVPSIGTSENSGFDLSLPYYLNLAPNYDATLSPRYLQQRGAMLGLEMRHLNRSGEVQLTTWYMPEDRLNGQARHQFILRDQRRFSKRLSARIDYNKVSDKRYLKELGDSLSLASITHLRRSAELLYESPKLQATVALDDYQTLDETIAPEDRPYQRLPRASLTLTPRKRPLGMEFRVQSDYVNFHQQARVTGERLDLNPRLSLPVLRPGWELTPTLGLRSTLYRLRNTGGAFPEREPQRHTPLASLDGRLFLQRNLRYRGRSYVNTLEPRLFYLYVPYRRQDGIPLFDTSRPTFSYRELFEENRFDGSDRMGDAKQLAVSLTTRILDPENGAERLRLAAGQILYLDDRRVTLEDTAPETDNSSDLAAELEAALHPHWSFKGNAVWNPRDRQSERGNLRIQYHPGYRRILSFSYRYLRGEHNQIDASTLWPLGRAWHLLGRWYYDIGDEKVLETLAGVEYDSCCWGFRLAVRNYVDDLSSEDNQVILAQLVLKGLTRFGSNIESLLEDGILGYTQAPDD